MQNRIPILGQKQSADNQSERLICDQFGRGEIGESDIVAAGGDGLGRLINTVHFRLDAGQMDRTKIKAIIADLPDYSEPDIIVSRQKEQRCLIFPRQLVISFFAPLKMLFQMVRLRKVKL